MRKKGVFATAAVLTMGGSKRATITNSKRIAVNGTIIVGGATQGIQHLCRKGVVTKFTNSMTSTFTLFSGFRKGLSSYGKGLIHTTIRFTGR